MTDRLLRFVSRDTCGGSGQPVEVPMRFPWSVRRYAGTAAHRGRPQVAIVDCDGAALFVVFSFKSMDEMEAIATEVARLANESEVKGCSSCGFSTLSF